jgi:uncharacterized protein (DUF2336 family)
MIIAQATDDPELAADTGIRADLPSELRRKLLQGASEAVKARLLSRAPPHLYEEIRSAIATAATETDREMSKPRDFAGARRLATRLSKEGRLTESVLLEFARQRRYEETTAALAELSGASIEVVRPLMQSLRSDGILIPCKAAGLQWATVRAVLDSRFISGSTGADELAKLGEKYEALSVDEAHRLLRLWQVRSASNNAH